MKKFLTLLFVILFCSNVYAADQKVTALTEETTPVSTDLLYMVDDPGGNSSV